MCSCINIIGIHFKITEQISKSGFFLSQLHNMVGIRDFQAKLFGRITMKSGWLDSL